MASHARPQVLRKGQGRREAHRRAAAEGQPGHPEPSQGKKGAKKGAPGPGRRPARRQISGLLVSPAVSEEGGGRWGGSGLSECKENLKSRPRIHRQEHSQPWGAPHKLGNGRHVTGCRGRPKTGDTCPCSFSPRETGKDKAPNRHGRAGRSILGPGYRRAPSALPPCPRAGHPPPCPATCQPRS